MLTLFATTPKGLELLLVEELRSLGAINPSEKLAGVAFEGDLATAYRACLWSRLANRILLQLNEIPAGTPEELYENVKAMNWHEHISENGTIHVNFASSKSNITHTLFGAQKVKDAIVDQLREKFQTRPTVSRENADVCVNVYLNRNRATISIDLSGESLHKRGYRLESGAAPLKENLAAAILLRAGWEKIAAQGGALIDPMCGSGTLLIEAAYMAANIAPGSLRNYFGFLGWKKHDAALWEKISEEAKAARTNRFPVIRGYDEDPEAITVAFANIERAGLHGKIHVEKRALSALSWQAPLRHCERSAAIQPQIRTAETKQNASTGLPRFARNDDEPGQSRVQALDCSSSLAMTTPGLLVTNPPYGERLGESPDLQILYKTVGEKLKQSFVGWQAAVFTGNPDLGKRMGLRSRKSYALFNGAIPCQLLLFDVQPEWFVDRSPGAINERRIFKARKNLTESDFSLAEMFANRIRKNLQKLKPWAEKENISCYRIYDADLPEYAVAVDCYGKNICVQEYPAPKNIDPEKAQRRIQHILAVLPDALNLPAADIFFYEETQHVDSFADFYPIEENGAKFLVNLRDGNIPVGFSLAERALRTLIRNAAEKKSFLHLASISGAMSVCAGLGGAKKIRLVDDSDFNLDWVEQNLLLNDVRADLVRAEISDWILEDQDRYDLIFVELPLSAFWLRQENAELIFTITRLLAKGGVLYLLSYDSRMKLEAELSQSFQIEEISSQLISPDFVRHPHAYQCWKISFSHS